MTQSGTLLQLVSIKGKGFPVTRHAGTKGGRSTALLILNLGARLGGGGNQHPTPVALPLEKRPGNHNIGD